ESGYRLPGSSVAKPRRAFAVKSAARSLGVSTRMLVSHSSPISWNPNGLVQYNRLPGGDATIAFIFAVTTLCKGRERRIIDLSPMAYRCGRIIGTDSRHLHDVLAICIWLAVD